MIVSRAVIFECAKCTWLTKGAPELVLRDSMQHLRVEHGSR